MTRYHPPPKGTQIPILRNNPQHCATPNLWARRDKNSVRSKNRLVAQEGPGGQSRDLAYLDLALIELSEYTGIKL